MNNQIKREGIIGSRCISNYCWSIFLLLGGVSFIFVGLSSYFRVNLLPFVDSSKLLFIPQGLIMLFYGTLSVSLSLYIIITIIFDIGGGYNEYNKREHLIKIVRKGFPGKNRSILLTYSLDNINAIGVKVTEGLNPKRNIYLCLNDSREIPLIYNQKLKSVADLEYSAIELAKFLNLKTRIY